MGIDVGGDISETRRDSALMLMLRIGKTSGERVDGEGLQAFCASSFFELLIERGLVLRGRDGDAKF